MCPAPIASPKSPCSRGWGEDDIVVNLQGDEPLMPPELVQQVAVLLEQHPDAHVATLAVRIGGLDRLPRRRTA